MSVLRFAALAQRKRELVELIADALTANAFANRFTLHPEDLPKIAEDAANRILHLLETEDPEGAFAFGDSLEHRGLAASSAMALLFKTRQFCSNALAGGEPALLEEVFSLFERLATSLISGFDAALEEEILSDQEQLRHALSTAIESQSRELLLKNHAIATSINGIVLADLTGQITYVNHAFLALWGYAKPEEIVGRRFDQLWVDDEGERILDRILSRGGWFADHTAKRADGSPLSVALSASVIRDQTGSSIGIMASLVDMTERKRLETQMQQVQKMDDLGQLAGGIVHDFNNLLTAIGGYLQLLLLDAPPDSRLARDLTQIKIAVDRGSGLTKQLHYFTRQATGTRHLVTLNDVARETAELLRHTFPPEIAIHLELVDHPWSIEADPNQMSQVLMNLCVNAREAIEERAATDSVRATRGAVTIETLNITLSDDQARSHANVTPGRYVLLRVNDTGVGMPPELVERLFIPFVSTKAEKRGGGLGLSVVYGIVRSHGGFINVTSVQGSGSTFFIYLPVAQAGSDGRPAQQPDMALAKGEGTILVVDDEEQVREIMVRSLEACGYAVHEADCADAALAVYTRHGPEIGLVILDMVMPGMGGRETLARLREMDPAVAVLLVTGYTSDRTARTPEELGAQGLIEKPLDIRRFTERVAHLMGEK